MNPNLHRRLAKAEQDLAEIEPEKTMADCICHAFVGIGPGRIAQFKEEMNRLCPVHGFRELRILHFVDTERSSNDKLEGCRIVKRAEVDELLREYELRLAQARRAA